MKRWAACAQPTRPGAAERGPAAGRAAPCKRSTLSAATAEDPKAVFQAMRSVFNDLVTEIQRSIGYFTSINRNAKVLAGAMDDEGLRVISGGTENHMFLVDTTSIDPELTGKEAATFLDEMGITLEDRAGETSWRLP